MKKKKTNDAIKRILSSQHGEGKVKNVSQEVDTYINGIEETRDNLQGRSQTTESEPSKRKEGRDWTRQGLCKLQSLKENS